MVKSIIKEIFVILLLIVAVMLILGIIFYDYRPSTKKIPSSVEAYTLSQEMSEELNETIQEAKTQNIVRTYTVDAKDLAAAENTDKYVKGKINPFDAISAGISNNTTGTNSTNETTTEKPNGSGNFLNTVK